MTAAPDPAQARPTEAFARPRLAHDHAHPHDHAHGHAHDPALIRPPGVSLLRASAATRLAVAAALSSLVWLGVWWAMR